MSNYIRVGDRVKLKQRGSRPPTEIYYGVDEGIVIGQYFGVDQFKIRLDNGRIADSYFGDELELLKEVD